MIEKSVIYLTFIDFKSAKSECLSNVCQCGLVDAVFVKNA